MAIGSPPLRFHRILNERWKSTPQRFDSNLVRAHVSSYETATGYLRKMRPILKSLDRDWEWKEMVAGIRLRYRNRPRFMEMLDRLDTRPILGRRREQN